MPQCINHMHAAKWKVTYAHKGIAAGALCNMVRACYKGGFGIGTFGRSQPPIAYD